jgi:hypothetical protein
LEDVRKEVDLEAKSRSHQKQLSDFGLSSAGVVEHDHLVLCHLLHRPRNASDAIT